MKKMLSNLFLQSLTSKPPTPQINAPHGPMNGVQPSHDTMNSVHHPQNPTTPALRVTTATHRWPKRGNIEKSVFTAVYCLYWIFYTILVKMIFWGIGPKGLMPYGLFKGQPIAYEGVLPSFFHQRLKQHDTLKL
jgi:hypothetical protein